MLWIGERERGRERSDFFLSFFLAQNGSTALMKAANGGSANAAVLCLLLAVPEIDVNAQDAVSALRLFILLLPCSALK